MVLAVPAAKPAKVSVAPEFTVRLPVVTFIPTALAVALVLETVRLPAIDKVPVPVPKPETTLRELIVLDEFQVNAEAEVPVYLIPCSSEVPPFQVARMQL